jgi:hypothetical protein
MDEIKPANIQNISFFIFWGKLGSNPGKIRY